MQPGTSTSQGGGDRKSTPKRPADRFDDRVNVAKEKARNLILEAEQFKTVINTPQGITANPFYDEGLVKDDDEFFHITCHIDESMMSKIEKGEFVNLEKLLPHPAKLNSREEVTQLVFKEGKPYFVNQSERDKRIGNVHKWEQAFHIYAAIYSNANPTRASEIWQYVYIINKAASCFVWNNVQEYDFVFRQMMSKNPSRSWGKTYSQMWNVCMTDPLPRQFHSQNFGNKFAAHSGVNRPGTSKKDKPDYCWKFNKGKCKFGANCKFVNKCSYCDSPDHGLNSCPRRTSAMGSGKEHE